MFPLIAGFLLLCVGNVHASTLSSRLLSVSELTARSSVIASGTVSSTSSGWDLNRTAIYTTIDLHVEQSFKGTDSEKTITFRQLGGRAGDIVSEIAGVAVFKTGEKVIVFLTRNKDQSLTIVGSFQGKFSVEKQPLSNEEIAIRRLPGVAKPFEEMPLEHLRMLIQSALSK